jgi:hypothetical protein
VVTRIPSLWRERICASFFVYRWRATLAGVIVGFLTGQAMALAWLAMSPGRLAREREVLEAATHCFKLTSQETKSSC